MDQCTALLDDGSECGREDDCTTVTVEAGGREVVRLVCSTCRKRMRLPDEDVTLKPLGG